MLNTIQIFDMSLFFNNITADDLGIVTYGYNPVMYDPIMPYEKRKELLVKHTKTLCHKTIDDSVLEILMSFTRKDLYDFIKTYRKLVMNK